jgi:ribosomal protein L11 methyltransferase
MNYFELSLKFSSIEEYQQDLLINDLSEIGYGTFEIIDEGFNAFIDAVHYDLKKLEDVLEQLDVEIKFSYTINEIEGKNWNEEWEKNFEPLTIGNDCYVRATFHLPQPQYSYEIVIDPKMAFGTGHHQTTTMMMEYILSAQLQDKVVLDMGCGTGILAILAAMKKAKQLVAIDNDPVCYESTLENADLNNVRNIITLCGGKEVIPGLDFDVILANINRNILLDQIPVYAAVLKPTGRIFFSGFYESPDLELLKEACLPFNLKYQDHKKNGDWVAAHFKKDR